MDVYTVPVTCKLCGGPGMAHGREMGETWFNSYYHQDQSICESYLRSTQRQAVLEAERSEEKPKC